MANIEKLTQEEWERLRLFTRSKFCDDEMRHSLIKLVSIADAYEELKEENERLRKENERLRKELIWAAKLLYRECIITRSRGAEMLGVSWEEFNELVKRTMISDLETRLTKILKENPDVAERMAYALEMNVGAVHYQQPLSPTYIRFVGQRLLDQPDHFFSEALARAARIIEAGNELCTRYWVEEDGTEKAVAFISQDGEAVIQQGAILTSSLSQALRALWVSLLEKATEKCKYCCGNRDASGWGADDEPCPYCNGTGYAIPEILKALIGEGKEQGSR